MHINLFISALYQRMHSTRALSYTLCKEKQFDILFVYFKAYLKFDLWQEVTLQVENIPRKRSNGTYL